ncbi:hypothetical protein [Flindersiella endophytica]
MNHATDRNNPEGLSAAMRRIADQTTPAAPDPAGTIKHRAGRLRRRRIAAAAVVGAAAVGLVVPVGVALYPSHQPDGNVATRTTTQPTTEPKPTQTEDTRATPTSTAKRGADGVAETAVDFGKLPRGKAPDVPWYFDGVIHDGAREIPFRTGYPWVRSLQKVTGGYVVVATSEGTEEPGYELFLVGQNGQRNSLDRETGGGLIFDPLVSDGGSQVAWSRFSGGATIRTTLNTYDVAAGKVTSTKQIVGGEESLLEVRAFLGSSILVNRATNALSTPVKIWDPRTGSLTDWHDSLAVAGTSADSSLVAVAIPGSHGQSCFAVLELPGKRQLWQSCQFNSNDVFFAANNRYVASTNHDVDNSATEEPGDEPPQPKVTSSVNVFASRTGEPVLRIKDQAPYQVAWESGDTFLFEATDAAKKHVALVRCTVTGTCELATAPEPLGALSPFAFAVRR